MEDATDEARTVGEVVGEADDDDAGRGWSCGCCFPAHLCAVAAVVRVDGGAVGCGCVQGFEEARGAFARGYGRVGVVLYVCCDGEVCEDAAESGLAGAWQADGDDEESRGWWWCGGGGEKGAAEAVDAAV